MSNPKPATIALALALLPGLSASAGAAPSPSLQQGLQEQPEQQQGADAVILAQMQVYLLSCVLGTQASAAAASVMHQIATTKPLARGDLVEVLELAIDSIETAKTSARHLYSINDLSAQEKSSATAVFKSLDEAHAIARKLEQHVQWFDQAAAEDIRRDSRELYAKLSDAQQTLNKIAEANQLSVSLSFPREPAQTEGG